MKKNHHLLHSIALALICTVFTSLGQLLLKLGSENFFFSFTGIITNPYLLLGCLFYGMGAIIMVLALKHSDLSMVYPLISLSFIWVSLLSWLVLGEKLVLLQWFGILIIITGVSFVGWGAQNA